MGLGGYLIWTRVFATISDREKKPITVCCMPLLSDILQGKMYNSEVSFCHDEIFQNNPRLEYTKIKKFFLFELLMKLLMSKAEKVSQKIPFPQYCRIHFRECSSWPLAVCCSSQLLSSSN